MKKIMIIILMFFSCMTVFNAASSKKMDIYAFFESNGKQVDEIKIKKNEKVKLVLAIDKKVDFDVYAVLGKLKYDKKTLELVNIKGKNDFTITSDKNILADRVEIKEKGKTQVFELEFKVLEAKKTQISFENIMIADDKEEKELMKTSINCVPSNILTFVVFGLAIIGAGTAAVYKFRKIKTK